MNENARFQLQRKQRRPVKPTETEPTLSRRAEPADAMLSVHQTAGNQAVQRQLHGSGLTASMLSAASSVLGNHAMQRLIQTKLTVGPPGDSFEREADRVADRVVQMPAPAPSVQRASQEDEENVQTKPLVGQISRRIQRASAEEEEVQTKPEIQRASAEGGFEASASLEDRLSSQKGGGSPLPNEIRAYMEPRFGADLSGVKVHTGSDAARLNREIQAQAFTLGQDIYLGEGKFSPASSDGKRLLAHELTHVVQQTGARSAQPKRVATEEET